MTVYLCGFMGCGKSTVGKRLAKLLGVSYLDMDEEIVKREGMTIPEIFQSRGEAYFRELETKLIDELGSFGGVVSCGGGAMLKDKNGRLAKEKGVVVFMDVPFYMCYRRISGDKNRPVAASKTREQLEELFKERYPKYKKNSTFSVKCTESPLVIANTIKEQLSIYSLKRKSHNKS